MLFLHWNIIYMEKFIHMSVIRYIFIKNRCRGLLMWNFDDVYVVRKSFV